MNGAAPYAPAPKVTYAAVPPMMRRSAWRPPVRGPSSMSQEFVACAAVLVLLPPSEGKLAPADGPPVDLASLTFPALTERREKALRALVKMAGGSRARAVANLGLSAGQAAEVDRDAALLDAPTARAG